MKSDRAFVMLLTSFALVGTPAFAQATRTWVSGVGDDANPCSRTAPCKTFAGAFSKTAAGGEINCIDAGGFGTLTITKALSIICAGGEAGVLASGTDGIIINAGASDIVHMSGLDVEGLGSGLSGVNIIQAGQVRIENSTIRGFTSAGVNVQPSSGSGGVNVDVIDTVIADNSGTGIRVKPSGGASVSMLVNRAAVSQNMGDGIMANGTLTTGSLNVAVRNSSSEFNAHCGFVSFSSGASSLLTVDESSALGNITGVLASGAGATVVFGRLTVTGNRTGVTQTSPGAALSYGNNIVSGNTSNGSFGTAPLQ